MRKLEKKTLFFLLVHHLLSSLNYTSYNPCKKYLLIIFIFSETSVTCEALSVPTSLIPGMYDWPPGYAYYRDQPLLELETGGHTMSFYVTENSFFRAYTAPHRVDIDLKLTNKNTGMVFNFSIPF